jgi:alkanesulfonate monooxygenase SsuD/methylene tetrahydromethanopterin reductase-like flavin-dependent oxidoreductase (luciferase family)
MEVVGRAQDPFLEGYTALGFLAGKTERITLALLVTGVTYRYPGVLAKAVTTLDVLSHGRTMLGIGAVWYQREHLALGIPYPPLRERFEMLVERLQICAQMWSANDGPYEGQHYRLAETICEPQPIRRPPFSSRVMERRKLCGWSPSTPTCGTAPRIPRTSSSTKSRF